MAVRSTQGQNRAVRSTQGGRGVSPSFDTIDFIESCNCEALKDNDCLTCNTGSWPPVTSCTI